jgi:4-oxalocrotonate tautomerase family enzyme
LSGGEAMPIVHIEMLSGRTKKQKEKLMESIFSAFEKNNIPREWVSIVISDEPKENWAISGELLSNKIKRERK